MVKISETTVREQLFALFVTKDPVEAKKATYDQKRDEIYLNGKYYPVDMEAKAVIDRLKLNGYNETWIKTSVLKVAKK